MKKYKIGYIMFLCLMLAGCKDQSKDALTTADPDAIGSGTEQSVMQEQVTTDEQNTKTEASTQASTAYIPDTTDYAQFYDDAPNTAQPRAYEESEVEIDITEDNFEDMLEDIYINAESYIGKMIRVRGYCINEIYKKKDYHYVYRMQQEITGHHEHMTGFEFTYNGEYPQNDEWVEVVGTLRQYMEDNIAYLTLDAISVKKQKKPSGLEQ